MGGPCDGDPWPAYFTLTPEIAACGRECGSGDAARRGEGSAEVSRGRNGRGSGTPCPRSHLWDPREGFVQRRDGLVGGNAAYEVGGLDPPVRVRNQLHGQYGLGRKKCSLSA